MDYSDWLLLDHGTRRVVIRACLQKRCYCATDARAAAIRVNRRFTDTQHAYRCPFCSASHLGHVPSVHQLGELALAVRDLHGDRPPRLATA